jgi:1-acyl-sn-glycerol-3-phosphate acyltransferase
MLQALAKFILRIFGWTMVGEVPDLKKAVFIAAPHTSNWDGFWLLVYKVAINVDVRFLGKHTLFWWPLGSILRSFGAMPIDRSHAGDIVPQLVDAFKAEEHLFLALSPEGTRKWIPYWKTGFYRIADAANVPIVLAFIDYGKKQMGIGPTLPVRLPLDETLCAITEFYAPFIGRRPDMQGPIEFPPA